jgi:hypothetical protein
MIGETLEHILKRTDESTQFGGSLLAMTFRDQARNWRSMVLAHVDTIIVTVHQFIQTLLSETIVDNRMREELWALVLLDKLQQAYCRAKDSVEFFLQIELNGRPSTYNHYFSSNLQAARAERLREAIKGGAVHTWNDGDIRISPSMISQFTTDKSNIAREGAFGVGHQGLGSCNEGAEGLT